MGSSALEGDTRGSASRYRAIETASEIYEINLARPHSPETMQRPVYGRWRRVGRNVLCDVRRGWCRSTNEKRQLELFSGHSVPSYFAFPFLSSALALFSPSFSLRAGLYFYPTAAATTTVTTTITTILFRPLGLLDDSPGPSSGDLSLSYVQDGVHLPLSPFVCFASIHETVRELVSLGKYRRRAGDLCMGWS